MLKFFTVMRAGTWPAPQKPCLKGLHWDISSTEVSCWPPHQANISHMKFSVARPGLTDLGTSGFVVTHSDSFPR